MDPKPPHISPAGHARLSGERDGLRRERHKVVEIVSWAAGNGDRSENADYQYGKRRLREIDRRLRFLDRRLREAVIADPADPLDRDRILFGATVTLADEEDRERAVTLLGLDEADGARGEISLAAPLARALLGRRVGETVRVPLPAGCQDWEILAIRYPVKTSQ